GLLELPRGEVYAHYQGWAAASSTLPQSRLDVGFAQHPLSYWDDQARFFGNGDKLRWRDQPALRVLPADQRLEPNYLAGVEPHLRLVIKLKLSMLNSQAQVGLHLQAFPGASVHGIVEDHVARLAT